MSPFWGAVLIRLIKAASASSNCSLLVSLIALFRSWALPVTALKLNASQGAKLRKVLLDCQYMDDPQKRHQVMLDMRKDYPEIRFNSSQDPAIEVAGVMDTCLAYGGADCLKHLLQVLESYEGSQSNTMKAVWVAWAEIVS